MLSHDLIRITEVWMKEELVIQGYHPAIRHDRKENQKGGGEMLLVHSSLQVLDCTPLNEYDCESVWCLIKLTNGTTLLVGVCYRAPGSVEEDSRKLNEMLLQVQSAQWQCPCHGRF